MMGFLFERDPRRWEIYFVTTFGADTLWVETRSEPTQRDGDEFHLIKFETQGGLFRDSGKAVKVEENSPGETKP
jgi:hypothetical protein